MQSALLSNKMNDRITKNPEIRGGKPCIQELRCLVENSGECLAGGMTLERILAADANA